jgi:hypothetical protein
MLLWFLCLVLIHGFQINSYFCSRLADVIDQSELLDLQSLLCHNDLKFTSTQTRTFHLLWECYDDIEHCQLPSIYIHTLSTLINYHPNANIFLWSQTLQTDFYKQITTYPLLEKVTLQTMDRW